MPPLQPQLPPAVIDELVHIYGQSAKKISKIVIAPPGSTANALAFNQARASAQLNQVVQEISSLKQKAADWTSKAIKKAVEKGVAVAQDQAVAAGIRVAGEDPIAVTWRRQASKMTTPQL